MSDCKVLRLTFGRRSHRAETRVAIPAGFNSRIVMPPQPPHLEKAAGRFYRLALRQPAATASASEQNQRSPYRGLILVSQ